MLRLADQGCDTHVCSSSYLAGCRQGCPLPIPFLPFVKLALPLRLDPPWVFALEVESSLPALGQASPDVGTHFAAFEHTDFAENFAGWDSGRADAVRSQPFCCVSRDLPPAATQRNLEGI